MATPAGPEGSIDRYAEVAKRPDYKGDWTVWGDNANRTYQMAYDDFSRLFGRAPTQNEFSQIMGAYQGANSSITGKAYLANLQQQYQSNPQLDPTNSMNPANKNAGDISSQVSQQFKSILGRDPTSDELQHFTEAIRSNQTDAYGLSAFLKQQPEYTNAQDAQFRSGLNTELQNYDTQEFGREKNDVMSDYASRGMGGSSSLDYALTDLMGKIAQNRSSYLASLSASQYGGNKDLAIGNYQNSLNQMYQNNQNQRSQNMAYGQGLINQGFQGANYGQQMNDYMNMMNSQRGYNNTLHTGDWINLGLGIGNTAAKYYGASKMGGGDPYGYLNG